MPASRIDNPHVAIDGSCGPPGHLYGHLHASCPVDGLTWQCGAMQHPSGARCDCVYAVSWRELDALNKPILEFDASECIHLPPCPKCGGLPHLVLNDTEYGLDLPHHHTMKMIREHIATRPAFAKLRCHEASRLTPKHQGFDFSHLDEADRPDHHRVVDLEQHHADLRTVSRPE